MQDWIDTEDAHDPYLAEMRRTGLLDDLELRLKDPEEQTTLAQDLRQVSASLVASVFLLLLCLDPASAPAAAAFFIDVLGALLLASCIGSAVTYREAHWVLLSYAGTAFHVLLHLCFCGRCGSCAPR